MSPKKSDEKTTGEDGVRRDDEAPAPEQAQSAAKADETEAEEPVQDSGETAQDLDEHDTDTAPRDADALVMMEVKGLALDPTSNVPIVLLREPRGSAFLPIWIGVFEANAIAMRLENVETPRPMSHDLMLDLVEESGAQVLRVVVRGLEESTFLAEIVVGLGSEELTRSVDARPSDAIALALRAQVPIFVKQQVLDQAKDSELTAKVKDEERIKKWLEDVDPDDLGKYTM